jgi:uncharacterized membrane protein
MSSGTDYGKLFKKTWEAIIVQQNLIVTLVGAAVMAVVGSVTMGILAGPLMLGFTLACIKIARGQPTSTDDLWVGFQRLVPTIVTSLIIGIGAFIGMMLCVVPGLIVMVLCTFVFHLMVDDKELSGMDAIKKSSAMVKANLTDVLIVWVIGIAINTVLAATVVGSIAGIAFATLMSAFLYEELRMREGAGPSNTAL